MGMRICLGCLNEVTDETSRCPLCSFSLEDPVGEDVLKPKSILNNRYVVGKALEIDGEGITYIGYDADLKNAVTIREYFPNSISIRQDEDIVVNQGKIATFKALKSEFIDLHKNLAKFNGMTLIADTREIFEQNGTVYATSDYIRGTTLNDYLRKNGGELDWNQVQDMFRPFMEDLLKINKSGYIHRGISTNTVLVDEYNTLKLIRFKTCSARVLDTEIVSNVEEGYGAPEQYKVLPNGEWTDVYGVCAVLYRVLTGTRPPLASSRAVNDNLIDACKLNETIPQNVSKSIMAGLRYDPRQRVRDLDQLMMAMYYDDMDKTNVIDASKNPLFDPYNQDNNEQTQYIENNKKGFINSLFDETDEVVEDYKEDKKSGKKSKSIMTKVLLASIPVIIILALVLYQLLVGFSFLGGEKDKDKNKGNKDNSSSSSMMSSESSSESSDDSSQESSESVPEESSEQIPEKPEGIPLVNFVGMRYQDISSYTSKFSFGEPSYVFDDKYAEGQICAQSVPEGTTVTPDQIIILSVSKGPRYLTVPYPDNKTAVEYKQYLKDYYKIDSIIVEEYNDKVQQGYVIDTYPKAGAKVDRSGNTQVKIYCSKGKQSSESESSREEKDD